MAPAVSPPTPMCPWWHWPPPCSGPRKGDDSPGSWEHGLAAGLGRAWGPSPSRCDRLGQSVRCRANCPRMRHVLGGRPPKGPAPGDLLPCRLEVEGEGWAHVQMSASPGPRKEDTFASHQPTASACPSDTCSSFLTGPGGSVARRERRTGARLVAAVKGSVLHSQHHPRAIWCPSRKGV